MTKKEFMEQNTLKTLHTYGAEEALIGVTFDGRPIYDIDIVGVEVASLTKKWKDKPKFVELVDIRLL